MNEYLFPFEKLDVYQLASKETRSRCEQIDRKLNGLINSLKGTRGRSYPGGDV
jgi:hypothetical protein